ncbi:MAG: hypothetical protein ABI835_13520 [Chloroflexota bacterium]
MFNTRVMTMIECSWDTETEAVILWHFSPGWTWQDFHASIDRTWVLLRERASSVPVDLIMVMDKAPAFPPGSPFAPIGRGMREISKQDGIVVAIIANQFQRTVLNVVRYGIAVVGTRLYGASSLDDARKIVARYRQVHVS